MRSLAIFVVVASIVALVIVAATVDFSKVTRLAAPTFTHTTAAPAHRTSHR